MAEKSFRAFDLAGRNAHTIPDVIRIDKHRLRGGEWPSTRGRSVVSQDVMDARVEEVLRCSDPSDACEHCGADGSDPSCDTDCYTSFVKSFLPTSLIELRGPGPLGYSTFVKRGVNLKKHTWLGEYIGELRPLKKVNLDLAVGVQSMYRFDVTLQDRETVVLDSEKAGNWTRYMNSSCEPNCEVWASCVGKRHAFLYRTRRAIKEGEELTFYYGKRYFQAAEILCGCSAKSGPHVARSRDV